MQDAELDAVEQQTMNVIQERVAKIPEERLQLPPLMIYGPTVQALGYTVEEPELRSMFANLLAISMDSENFHLAHPAYVEIIKQICPDEAKILRLLSEKHHDVIAHVKYHENSNQKGFTYLIKNISTLAVRANCDRVQKGPIYLTNLQRLGLVDIPVNWWYSDDSLYNELFEWFDAWKMSYREGEVTLEKSTIRLTSLGADFVRVCIVGS